MYRKFLPPIHKEGYYFVVIFAVVTVVLGSLLSIFGYIGIVATLWCIYFFRNPDRITPVGENLVVSPADGFIQKIELAPPPPELNMGNEERVRVSIFLSVFNVHVNRIPTAGVIKALHYNPGRFLNASLDKASIYNERQSILLVSKNDKEIAFTQIAGLIARRIVCDLQEGQDVNGGERFGIIRFGSRMDVYLPVGVNSLAVEGQYSVGGETILADLSHPYETRKGEIR